MHEVRSWIVSNPAPAQRNSSIPDLPVRAATQAQIDCLTAHVQAVLGYSAGSFAQHGIGARGTVGTEDLEFAVRFSNASLEIVEKIEELGINYCNFAGSVISQKFVELSQRVALIGITYTVGNFDLLVSVKLVEREDARSAILSCSKCGYCSSG